MHVRGSRLGGAQAAHTSLGPPAAANLIFMSLESNLSLNEKTSASAISLLAGVFFSSILPLTMASPINAGLSSSRGICVSCTAHKERGQVHSARCCYRAAAMRASARPVYLLYRALEVALQ
jgi:hypothetical protein